MFYGVLPRERFSPDEIDEKYKRPKVSGRSKHVDRALFIFCDIDYKEEVRPNTLPENIRKAVEEQGYYIEEKKRLFRGTLNKERGELKSVSPDTKDFWSGCGRNLRR